MKIAPVFVFVITALACSARADEKWDISKVDVSKLPAAADKKALTYEKDIRPLFEASCLRCHGENRPKASLRLDSLESVLKGGKDGKVVVPGQSAKSLLVIAAAQINDDTAMPPKRGMGRGGPGGPGGPPGGTGGQGGANHPPASAPGGQGGPPPGGAPGNRPPGGGGGGGGGFGPPPKPLTSEQVALLRAWVDQGAK